MPDIDPAALSRPVVTLSTPVLASKTLSINAAGPAKMAKASQIIPVRIDLEPLYGALKAAVGGEQWLVYKEATAEFLTGRLSQAEYSGLIDPMLGGDSSDKYHLHNQLFAAILGNVTREMPDQGIAPWVSANDKPVATVASKPVTGDAAERRLKGDVMQLPARDRRRIKDLAQTEYEAHETLSNTLLESYRKPSVEPPSSAVVGGINKMNFDLEIRKRFAQPLAVESGEFPDVGLIAGRMLPFCYEAGLAGGHVGDAPQLMGVATETFIKEMLTLMFSRTRSNGPGDSGSGGYGAGTTWIQTRKYQRQLGLEEDAAQRGELTRDKSGLLPVEAKAAGERAQLGMADMRLSLELSDTGMALFPALRTQVLLGYRDGELENWNDYTWLGGKRPEPEQAADAAKDQPAANGHADAMDVDGEPWWEGAEDEDMDVLNGILDSCLAVGS